LSPEYGAFYVIGAGRNRDDCEAPLVRHPLPAAYPPWLMAISLVLSGPVCRPSSVVETIMLEGWVALVNWSAGMLNT
jgi:hypothetical protein